MVEQFFTMNFIEGSYDANVYNDEINNLSQVIHEFCRITNQPKFRFTQVLDHMLAFRSSTVLKCLMDKPSFTSAQTCLQNFFQTHPQLPQIFINRFLSVISAEVQLTRQNVNYDNTTLKANVVINNVIPKKKITASTLPSRVSNLQNELNQNSDIWTVVPFRNTQPYKIKINMDDEFMQTLIREQSNLNKTIQEANRCNGQESDSFITTQIMYS